MTVRHGITLLAIVFAACGNKADVQRAKRSLYDTDFAIVYSKVLEATREIYPSVDDNPGTGAIKTVWHPVPYGGNTQDDLSGNRSLSTSGANMPMANSPAAAQAGMPTRLHFKKFFIRFDVTVLGGRPWRVKVIGHASEWEPGAALPVELTGPAKPSWLDPRTDALTLAIYKKLKPYAIPMKEDIPEPRPEDLIPKTDPKSFANVPPAAAKRLAELKDAVGRREYALLREQLFDDVAWSIGGSPGADTAMAMWQADPEPLDAMAKVIGEACVVAEKRVLCGELSPGKWQLVLEHRDGTWKVASFVRAE